jgi:hypothetical protein
MPVLALNKMLAARLTTIIPLNALDNMIPSPSPSQLPTQVEHLTRTHWRFTAQLTMLTRN